MLLLKRPRPRHILLASTLTALCVSVAACSASTRTASESTAPASSSPAHRPTPTTSHPPAVNVYAAAGVDALTGAARQAKPLVYVPNSQSNTVDVIDPSTYRIVDHFPTGREPQHVVPSWDMKTLWVNDDHGNDLIPIDPTTGKPGPKVSVMDPYNLYFTPDGSHALVMAERLRRIDVHNPHTMAFERSLPVPCYGINHADFSADLSYFVASCEFSGKLLVIDRNATRIIKTIDLNAIRTPGATSPGMAHTMGGPKSELRPGATSMPQDVRLTPDGTKFLVADMLRNGVWVINAKTAAYEGFIHTGTGAHGIYPDRGAKRLFISNRDAGSISVLNAKTLTPLALWKIPGGGSPDMGGVSADGRTLWLSGRYDGVVYVFDTTTGNVLHRIRVGAGPHGLAVWPQPGRFSLGHTGNMR